jgi:hypothetical protein
METQTITLIVNWNTLGEALGPESTYEFEEKFLEVAKEFASENGYEFDTARDHKLPGFFFSTDGETQDNDLMTEGESAFNIILERTACRM